LITAIGSRSSSNRRPQRLVVHAVGLVLQPIHFDGALVDAGLALERVAGHANLMGRPDDDPRQLSRAVADGRDAVTSDHRGRRVDCFDHVVERARELVDVSRSIGVTKVRFEALDDRVRDAVALVLDVVDLQRRLPVGRLGGQHAVEHVGRETIWSASARKSV
jgi:hypothetical protein